MSPGVTAGAGGPWGPHNLTAGSDGGSLLAGHFASHMSVFFFSLKLRENAKSPVVIPCNLTRCTQNDTTAISPGIDQKNILFLHESSICSSASFKTTVSSLCWLATAPAYPWTTYPGKKKTNPKLQEFFCLSSLSHCPLASSPHSFSYRVCLSFLMSSLAASPLWKFSKMWPTSQSCCSAPCYPLCCQKMGLPAHSWPSAVGSL